MILIKRVFLRFYNEVTFRTALWFAVILTSLCTVGIYYGAFQLRVFLVVLISIQLIGVVQNKFWKFQFAVFSTITYPIGQCVSFIMIGFVYFIVVVPIALLKKNKFNSGWIDSVKQLSRTKQFD